MMITRKKFSYKQNNYIKQPSILILLCLFILIGRYHNTYSTGFTAGTLIKTPKEFIPIENLLTNTLVVSYPNVSSSPIQRVMNTHHYTINHGIKITIENTELTCATNQLFYSISDNQWIEAQNLQVNTLLKCYDTSFISVKKIEHIYESVTIYGLSIEENHTFYVSPHLVLAHNSEPTIIVATTALACAFPPAAPIIIGAQAIVSFFVTGFGCYLAYKKYKKHKASTQEPQELTDQSYKNSYPQKPNNDDEDDNHPHGIYENASYHTNNGNSYKSPCPQNGQQCLDYSLRVKDGLRVAIEDNKFVILRRTAFKKFHGYVIEWSQIHDEIQLVLRRNGYATKSGKIIKKITEKMPL